MTSVFAVTGKPIFHSKSPQLQNEAFAAAGIDAVYIRLAADTAREALETATDIGMRGLNVTSPFKEDFASIVHSLDKDAELLGAVNTVIIDSAGKLHGFNTDVNGVQGALESNAVQLKGKKAVVLGAGGAAKAAVLALMRSGAQVTIANRSRQKAEAVAMQLNCSSCALDDATAISAADILVSAVSTVERLIPASFLRKGMTVLEANYSKQSMLSVDAKEAGCKYIYGEEWLLHTAAKSFEIFIGKKPDMPAMAAALAEAKKPKSGIVLTGFMATGKSSVAKCISEKTDMKLIDTDDEIEKRTNRKIADIIKRDGEKAFRSLEEAEAQKAGSANNAIIATGGGMLMNQNNLNALKQNANVVLLWVNANKALQRAGNTKSRPLLDVPDKEAAAKRLLESRLPAYVRAADLIVSTSNTTVEKTAELIIHELRD